MTKEQKQVEEIIHTMIDLHTIRKDETIELSKAIEVYEDCIDSCPEGFSLVSKNLRSDLKRFNELEHKLPDLLSSLIWATVLEEFQQGVEDE